MADALNGTPARQELVQVIRQVRSRWRMRVLLQGGFIILLGALAAIAIASYGLQTFKFSPQSVTGFRIGVFAVFALLVGVWFVRPLGRRVTDLQVALYVEEHEPSLQAAILSAVDLGAVSTTGASSDVPQVIIDKLIAQAIEKCKTLDGGRRLAARACAARPSRMARSPPSACCCSSPVPSSSARARRRSSCCHEAPRLPAHTRFPSSLATCPCPRARIR
jgi:hypothetical protein